MFLRQVFFYFFSFYLIFEAGVPERNPFAFNTVLGAECSFYVAQVELERVVFDE